MTSYEFPPASGGYRAQCLHVTSSSKLVLLVEWRDGLYERIKVELAGVGVPEYWEGHKPVRFEEGWGPLVVSRRRASPAIAGQTSNQCAEGDEPGSCPDCPLEKMVGGTKKIQPG